MSTKRYCIFVIPVAHKPAANLLLALVNGDDPALSDSFSQGANADGSYNTPENLFELATHFFGGDIVTEEWESIVSNLATNTPEPVGGYPWNGITLQDAKDAAAEIYMQVSVTQNDIPPSPSITRNNAMANLNLVQIVE